MKTAGFLLIEALIYLALSSLFFLLIFQFTIESYNNYKNIGYFNSQKSSLLNLVNLLTRDIQHSSSDISFWKKINNNELIFSTYNSDIGYILKNNKISRIEGQYNKATNQWINKITSLACKNIKNFVVQINKPQFIKLINNQQNSINIISFLIEANFEGKNIKITKSVSPNNGVILSKQINIK